MEYADRQPVFFNKVIAILTIELQLQINREAETQTSIHPQNVPSASGDNGLITSKERTRLDSLSQQSRAHAHSLIEDTENPEINRSGSLVRARAPSFIDPIRDSVS